ncbi:EAL domain-containing protein [Alteromonas stellipolaris]|uniref:EAL domain-containing protein n=1 Tax=Alteromonas stellipolaris TaxID=233316 RepID=UPI001D8BE681|nr:EAL domain-containing protein [Alteromonas stellipolaris]MBZ2164266.1 EAL domain-containing protein [Alteromonas stellipolaris]
MNINNECKDLVHQALGQSALPIFLVDINSVVSFANTGAIELLNGNADTVVGNKITTLFGLTPKDLASSHNKLLTTTLLNPLPHLPHIEALRLSISYVVTGDQNHYVVFMRDITQELQTLSERNLLSNTINQIGQAILVLSTELQIMQSNTQFQHLVGYSEEELLGSHPTDYLIHEQDNPILFHDIRQHVERCRTFDLELIARTKFGEHITLDIQCSPYYSSNSEKPEYFIALVRDVTAQQRIRTFEQFALRTIIESFDAYEAYLKSYIQSVLFCDIFILTEKELSETKLNSYRVEEVVNYTAAHPLAKHLGDSAAPRVYIHPIIFDGAVQAILTMPVIGTVNIKGPIKELINTVARFTHLAIEKQQTKAQIKSLTRYNPITGLPIQDYFENKALSKISREQNVSVISIVINNLDCIYESFGSVAAEQIFNAVACILKEVAGDEDTIGQSDYGQFHLVTKLVEPGPLLTFIEMLSSATQANVLIGETPVKVSTSLGISSGLVGGERQRFKTVCEQANAACNRAGINKYEFYNCEQNSQAKRELIIGASLTKAIEDNELNLLYQPQINLKTGELYGVEALSRWESHIHGQVSPDTFVALAEQLGAITRLSLWILRTGIKQLALWDSEGINVPHLSVNITASDLEQSDLPSYINRLLCVYNISGKRLTLEVTESAAITLTKQNMNVISQLREMGIGLSMDDFGTGYSNLANLAALPVTEIKIDRSFINGENSRLDTLVSSVISMGDNLGISIVAEGIEDKTQLGKLSKFGCPIIQGYYFSKPLNAEGVFSYINEDKFRPLLESIEPGFPPLRLVSKC